MNVSYTPITIRYLDNEKNLCLASSGVLILSTTSTTTTTTTTTSNQSSFHKGKDLILTINHIPNISQYKIYTSHRDSLGLDNVEWHQTKLLKVVDVPMNDLAQLSNGCFSLLPRDYIAGNVSIMILTSPSSLKTTKATKIANQQLQVAPGEKVAGGDIIRIISSPFNATNLLVFRNFISMGNVVYNLHDAFYFTDIKYLDDMNGAIVLNKNSQVIGLVLGCLRKKNGDGELTVIIPWSKVAKLAKIEDSTISSSPHPPSSSSLPPLPPPKVLKQTTLPVNLLPSKINPPVFPIIINSNGNHTWGSTTLYKPNVFITNAHVVAPYLNSAHTSNSNDSSIEIRLKNRILALTLKDTKIIIPSPDIDLAFLILDKQTQNITFPNLHIVPFNTPKGHSPLVNEDVYTISYGLFPNTQLVSHGIINCVYQTPDYPAMIVCSASCWNGSSGGALINNKNELVGVICCNAEVPSLQSPQKTEKITDFTFVLPVAIIDHCWKYITNDKMQKSIVLDPRVGKLWKLEPFHLETFVELSKF